MAASASMGNAFSSTSWWTAAAAAAMTLLVGYITSLLMDGFDPESLKGKRVLLTGASMGIGEQMAYHYAKYGANLVITARSEDKLQKVIARCREISPTGRFEYVLADMSELNETQKLVQEAVSVLGGLDLLVLNHIRLTDLGDWAGSSANLSLHHSVININFHSYVHMASHALRHLEESGGSFVVVSSIAGRIPQPYLLSYSASKFALEGFFSGLRQELTMRNSPVSVTLCIIGFIGTDNTYKQLDAFGLHRLLNAIPIAKPVDAALAIVSGSAQRFQEVYFPYMQSKPASILRNIIPQTFDLFNRFLYKRH